MQKIIINVPVPIGGIGYYLTRSMFYNDFQPTPVRVTGYFLQMEEKIEVRTETESGKIQYRDITELFPTEAAARSLIPAYIAKYGGGNDAH